jgi:putative ABC transport system permease protein
MQVIEKNAAERAAGEALPADTAFANSAVMSAAGPDYWSKLGPMPIRTDGSMAIGQSIASALVALCTNQLRAFLTALGIIIGVAAVIVMVALGSGASASIQQRLAGLGTNLLTIQSGSAGPPGEARGGAGSLQTLTDEDVAAIQEEIPGLAAITPSVQSGNVQVIAGNQNWNTTVQAGYPSLLGIQNWSIASGAAYDSSDEASSNLVCDIGATVATNLFGTANPVGQQIMVRNVPFTVKGVLAAKGSSGFRDEDDIILVPYSTAQVRLFGETRLSAIYVQVADAAQIPAVQSTLEVVLRAQHHLTLASQTDDFRIFNNQQLVQTVESTTQTLKFLLGGVAAVSLIVGGIGIMNIMLVSVTERTREIGIRLAVGARPSTILTQFLIEAVILSVVGGAIGILFGFAASTLLGRLAGWMTLVTPSAVLISFGFAASVGIFFGFYPARRASRLNPIDALHYE